MRAATVSSLLLVCLSFARARTTGDEPRPAADDLEALLSKAAAAPIDEYVALRSEVSSLELDRLRGLNPREGRGWKEQVIARAWIEWRRAPHESNKLWTYRPPRNRYRNPFPWMIADAERTFEEAGEPGLVIARELVLKKGEVLHGALPNLLAEDGSELSRQVLVEAALHLEHRSLATNLVQMGHEAGQDVLLRLDEAHPRCLPELIRALGEMKLDAAIPKLGRMLASLEKQGEDYHHSGERVGLALVEAMSRLTGEDFTNPDLGWQESRTASIDAAKKWWKQNGERYRKKERGDGEGDGI